MTVTTPIASPVPARPFFLASTPGERFCLFHPAAPGQYPLGALLYIHPFAEELNKSRRMAALQSRALATAGFHVLQVDLYGCGDSSGDLADARWAIWKDDLVRALGWLSNRVPGPYGLWGLRLGALLALDVASDSVPPLCQLILWQPPLKGKTCIDQFLRLELAGQMLAGASADLSTATPTLTASARQRLAAGSSVEVAGYRLTPELASDIDGIDAAGLCPSMPLSWFDISPSGQLPASADARARQWRDAGASVSLHAVTGAAFWNSMDVTICPDLLTRTTLAAESGAASCAASSPATSSTAATEPA